jgi:hypothetical protein
MEQSTNAPQLKRCSWCGKESPKIKEVFSAETSVFYTCADKCMSLLKKAELTLDSKLTKVIAVDALGLIVIVLLFAAGNATGSSDTCAALMLSVSMLILGISKILLPDNESILLQFETAETLLPAEYRMQLKKRALKAVRAGTALVICSIVALVPIWLI